LLNTFSQTLHYEFLYPWLSMSLCTESSVLLWLPE
jgi:hypothetical protein